MRGVGWAKMGPEATGGAFHDSMHGLQTIVCVEVFLFVVSITGRCIGAIYSFLSLVLRAMWICMMAARAILEK